MVGSAARDKNNHYISLCASLSSVSALYNLQDCDADDSNEWNKVFTAAKREYQHEGG
jgi:hypothetical protein